jgi:hypothetical protein
MKRILFGVGTAAALAGCSMMHDAMSSAVGSTVNTAGNVAGQRVGTAIGESVSARLLAAYQPQMMAAYTSYIFSIAFSSGGYSVQQGDYAVGDWTRWNWPTEDGSVNQIERARLADDDKGNQWWKVKFVNNKQNETTTLEGLFSHDRSKLLRLRGKFPKEEAKEVPVTDQTYYVPPTKLTDESVAGATVGTESVTVPAGSFSAKHVVYAYGNGTQEWWLTEGVPGGLVKQSLKGSKEDSSKNQYTITLAAKGNDAKDELGAIK